MRSKALSACIALVLVGWALPAFAGTVYVPVLTQNGLDDTEYVTRVWLTNQGNQPVTVETLFLADNTDGTKGRDNTGKNSSETVVRAGRTAVIDHDGKSGLLEITTSEGSSDLAVSAAILVSSPNPGARIYSPVPVLSSRNLTEAGKSLTLQGLRRTNGGVATNLSLVNLGHKATQCSVTVSRSNGDKLAGTALLSFKALSQVQFADALAVLGQSQAQDVNAQISCDQAFFSYLTTFELETGELQVVRPSMTGDSALFPPGQEIPSVPGAILFSRNGTFHTPTPAEPSRIYNIPVPAGKEFRNVVVDFDFYHGGWYGPEPNKLHSLFWLHRGACCWPKWRSNITGFANAHGPGLNRVKMISNMGISGFDKSKGEANVGLQPGHTYHLHFEYDTTKGVASMEITEGGNRVAFLTMPTTVSRLRPDDSEAWMIYFGHENAAGSGHGAERPTYGWKYQNLRVEFLP